MGGRKPRTRNHHPLVENNLQKHQEKHRPGAITGKSGKRMAWSIPVESNIGTRICQNPRDKKPHGIIIARKR